MSGGCGILLVDKNEGFTSSDTVRMLARRLKVRKVGHTGTLDKFASGLLVCLAGPFTRLARYMVEQDKEYEARL
jgi:tRNA pseudouridine55 synthase